MKINSRLPAAVMLGALVALAGCGPHANQTRSNTNTPGATDDAGQVVARVNGEEITIHQLNIEAAMVPMAGQNPKLVQKEVLRAIVYRTMLRQAAVKDKLDRNPNVQLLIEATKDKVLAESYVGAQTGTTPPPTSNEIDKFISDNPLQFGERRIYSFQRLTLGVNQYSQLMVPLFDQKDSFDDFESYLDGKSIAYTIADVRLPSTDFPKQVQDELVKFSVGDNVVVRGAQSIVILKVKSWVDMPVEENDAERVAENTLHQQAIENRATSLRDQLTHSAKVEFLGAFAGTRLEEPAPPAPAPAKTGANVAPTTDTALEEGHIQ